MSSQLAPTETTQSTETTTPTPTDGSDEMGAESLSLDLVFEVLKNERRRRVLAYLREHDGTVSLSDVAEHIAAVENEKPETALSSQERKRVYVGLYQCHLPKMDDTDVIEFDGNRGTVALGDNAELLYPFLEAEADQRRPWPTYYLGHTALSLTLFGAVLLAVPSVATPVFGASLLGFAALGVAHHTMS
ncbi:DUF7344 domain-containing protein [Halohasta salina]|uniref:DUF7344 domain-containing protein n=1 Tax=Halohasta salina TaxID=2961621 RepID=UPI0020A59C6F|nr:hypothetical protein [Halohasta salina]